MAAAVACGTAHQDAGKPGNGPSARATAPTPGRGRTSASPTASAKAACGTAQLRWRLTLLADKASKAPTALLSATNTSAVPCRFDGYPKVQAYAGKGPAVWSEPRAKATVRLVLDHGNTVDFPLFYPASPSVEGSCAIPVDDAPRIEVLPPHPASTDYGASLQITDPHGRRVTPVFCGTIRVGAPRPR
ncbi:DUF4232 domain-containing protein [Streptomyces mirabilis]|uniref:DUF4232 domain-containing protein n=1 Tax=Streptomyces mirabilis TaxID=68239 RepID=UPI0036F1719A